MQMPFTSRRPLYIPSDLDLHLFDDNDKTSSNDAKENIFITKGFRNAGDEQYPFGSLTVLKNQCRSLNGYLQILR